MKGMIAVCCLLLPSVSAADVYQFAAERCVIPQVRGDEFATDDLQVLTPEEAGIVLAIEQGNPQPEVFADRMGNAKRAVNFRGGMRACRVWGFEESFDALADKVIMDVTSLGLETSDDCRGHDKELGQFALAVLPGKSLRNRFIVVTVTQADDEERPEIMVFETPIINETSNCVELP